MELPQNEDMQTVTRIVEINPNTRILCPNPNVRLYEHFYLPLITSSVIHNNEECLSHICSKDGLYIEEDGIKYLGPFEDLWKSPCFPELGHEIIGEIVNAKFHSANKFWPFEKYDFVIYSNLDHLKTEASYLSKVTFSIELILASFMTLISIFTVFGNGIVFIALAKDDSKSVYQYFQISLCLADALMGLSGSGAGIALVQFSLLFGSHNLQDFVEGDIFTASFSRPEAVVQTRLNRFYFMTSDWKFIIRGFMVSLSTTVSLALICTMAYIRKQVVSTMTGPNKLFGWIQKHEIGSSFIIPWAIGTFITSLHFLDPFSYELLEFKAYFDPVSKLTILLPSTSMAFSFYMQALLGAIFTIMTVIYSILAWKSVSVNANAVSSMGVSRIAEERRWLRTTLAVAAAFLVTVTPLFMSFTISSTFNITIPAIVHLIVWWLLVTGAALDIIIYACMNATMRKSIKRLFYGKEMRNNSFARQTTRTRTTSLTAKESFK